MLKIMGLIGGIIFAGVVVIFTFIFVFKNKGTSLDEIISDNSTFPNGSHKILTGSLRKGLDEKAPLPVSIPMLNDLNMRIDNSSLVAETNRLSYFFVRLPPDSVGGTRSKRTPSDNEKSIGIRFGDSDAINVIPLNLASIENSGVTFLGTLKDESQVYKVDVKMGNSMCENSDSGSCSIATWTPYFVYGGNIASKAPFSNKLPVACGFQCNADADSPCAMSCSTCDGLNVAGANTPVTRRYKMGTMAAENIIFSYETYEVKDQITVSYEGKTIFSSGCVGTQGERYVPISFEGNSVEIRVDVEPNCDGTDSTQWYFTLPCVDCKNCKEYKCLDDSKAHCGNDGYLMSYGFYYCSRFYEYYDQFNAKGQDFIDCARPRLLDYLENYLSKVNGKVDCKDLYDKAFDSHIPIYMECNFCDVFFSNFNAFTKVVYESYIGGKINLSAWKQLGKLVFKCGFKEREVYKEFSDTHPDLS